MTKKTILVFSGGQDSTTCLFKALKEYDEVHCITFDYGQRHHQEIDVAKKIAKDLKVNSHKIMNVELLNELAISALTRDNIPVSHVLDKNGLPNSFVPGRNILFLTLAGIYAYQIDAKTIITGVCETDFSGYPDCRNRFIQKMNDAINEGMDSNIKIETPLMWLNKAETWAMADELNALDYIREQTLTCYNGVLGYGCQTCPACQLRKNGLSHYLENKETIMKSFKQKNNKNKNPL